MGNDQTINLTPAEILKALNNLTGLPIDILQAASANRNALAPLFIKEIESYLAHSPNKRKNVESGAAFFGYHFLAEWNEKSAYRTVARLLRIPSKEAEDFFADASTETSDRIMASLFDGDPQPIIDIILDSNAYDAIRATVIDAFLILIRENLISREQLAAILRDIFDKLEHCRESFVWSGWLNAVAMAGFEDMFFLAKRVFNEKRIEDDWMHFDDFEIDLRYGVLHPYHPENESSQHFAFWKDTVAEFQSMSAVFDFGGDVTSGNVVHVNFRTNVGRHGLCPCGSGKKFRLCCGR